MKGYHDSFVKTGEINTTLLRLAEGITAKLASEIPDVISEPSLIRRLQERIVKLGCDLEDSKLRDQIDFPLAEMWQSYLEKPAYQLSLWGSQRVCYVSIYNSYENFITRAVSIARSIASCRTTDRDFNKYLTDSLGSALFQKCWTRQAIHIARLARHALSHAGGRVTDDLGKQKHGFDVRDGRIQVTPTKTKELFAVLKDSVYALAEKATTMPEFT